MRIGLDNVYGYIDNVEVWSELGNTLEKAKVISIDEFDTLAKNNGIQIVDLRGVSEYNAGHVPKADNVFVGTLQENLDKISKDKTTVIYCQSGDRTAIGYSLLAKNGFKNILNYSGGMSEWSNKGKPVVS
jgi:hydroxyacylglutathione hydrolase